MIDSEKLKDFILKINEIKSKMIESEAKSEEAKLRDFKYHEESL